jgi:outer membrane immunogenic protein
MGRFGWQSTEQETSMKRILMASALALAAGTQALAADLPPPMAPPPRAPAAYVPVAPAFTWTGLYLGLNGGFGFGSSKWTSAAGVATSSFSVDGFQVGGTIGGNYQINQLVLGLEGDFDWQNLRGSTPAGTGCPGSCDTSSNWIGTVRGRVGYAFDRVLVYGTGGGAFTDVRASQAALPWSSSTKVGWTAGGGLEYAFTDNWTTKVEYLFADFQGVTCAVASCGIAAPTSVNFYENMVRVGVNYKF